MADQALLPVKIEKGVEFATHDGTRLTGDLYRPAGGASHPLLIAVHGGGWQRGAAASYQYWGDWLAARGIAVFSIEYRLFAGERNRYPAAVHDTRAAVQFVRANAPRFGADPARIGLMGDSAGAHLATLTALAGDGPLFAAGERGAATSGSTAVKAVVGVYGVYDLLAQWEHDQLTRPRDHITEGFLGVSALENKFRYFEASPIAHATIQAPRTAYLLAWGLEDDIVEWQTQSAAMVKALQQARFFVRSVAVPGAGHFWMSDPLDEHGSYAALFAPKLLRFLKEQL